VGVSRGAGRARARVVVNRRKKEAIILATS
jgi:hypothetical protein